MRRYVIFALLFGLSVSGAPRSALAQSVNQWNNFLYDAYATWADSKQELVYKTLDWYDDVTEYADAIAAAVGTSTDLYSMATAYANLLSLQSTLQIHLNNAKDESTRLSIKTALRSVNRALRMVEDRLGHLGIPTSKILDLAINHVLPPAPPPIVAETPRQ